MPWLLYLPTRELADAVLAPNAGTTNAVVEVSGNWEEMRHDDDYSFPLQPVAAAVEEPVYG
ncbi:MAG: hypothetical protein NT113_19940 [Hyphomicrobiales bacterium]|jgi:hypothetical protein|nr:hypothetical protein [Hyphomicrobiales bacterium]